MKHDMNVKAGKVKPQWMEPKNQVYLSFTDPMIKARSRKYFTAQVCLNTTLIYPYVH